MIKFNDVSIHYNGSAILKNIAFDIFPGEKVLVGGKSGIGKSSVIKAILGFTDYKGEIQVNGLSVNSNNIEKIRKLVTYMPQEINMPMSSVKEFFNFSMTWGTTKKGTKKQAFDLLGKFKIEKGLLDKQISEISGGQKQRILLAACIAQDKPVLLLDEPDSSVDSDNKSIIRDYLLDLDKTIVIISHDLEWSKHVDKTINLNNNG